MIRSILCGVALAGLSTSAFGSEFAVQRFWNDEGASFDDNSNANYYEQFLFSVDGDCKDISTVWFHEASAVERAQLGNDAQGRPAEAWLSVQLFSDGTYWAEYGEHAIKKRHADGWTEFDTLFTKKDIEGTWKVNGDQISLSGLGTGVPSKYTTGSSNEVNSFKFTLQTKINDQRAVNNPMNFISVGTNQGPKGVSINQYCGVN